MIRSILKAVLVFLGITMAVGTVQSIRNPAPKWAAPQISPEEETLGKDIATRAYAVGKALSKAGAIKPSSDQLDAMSRRMQTAMGFTGSKGWFKQQFEMGFWEGWKSR